MSGLLSTMFASRESYLSQYINKRNFDKEFPVSRLCNPRDVMYSIGCNPVIVSGGSSEERSAFIMETLKLKDGCKILIHNGNRYLEHRNVAKYCQNVYAWDEDIYAGMNKYQMISMLSEKGAVNELVPFYAFACEVCEVLGIPTTIHGLASIDWLGVGWQRQLAMNQSDRERAMDLLSRYDCNMAAKSVEAMCKLEQMTRTPGSRGIGIAEAILGGKTLVKQVYGSDCAITKQCLNIALAEAEKGRNFSLVLDDIYIPNNPLIKDNFRNVSLMLSANDIYELSPELCLTNRPYDVVLFRHANYASAKAISERYMGEFDKLISESSVSNSRPTLGTNTYTNSLSVRRGSELRLKPEKLMNLGQGEALIRLCNGTEGKIRLG